MASAKGSIGITALGALKSDHSGLVQVTAATMAPNDTEATTAAHLAFVVNQKFATALSRTGKSAQWDLDTSHFGSTFLNLIDQFRITEEEAAQAAETRRFESGVIAADPQFLGTETGTGSTSATSNDLFAINYIGEDLDDSTKILVEIAVCNFTQDSGGYTTNLTDEIKPKATLQTKKAKAAISIPVAMFDSTYVTPTAAQEIPEGQHFVRLSLPKTV